MFSGSATLKISNINGFALKIMMFHICSYSNDVAIFFGLTTLTTAMTRKKTILWRAENKTSHKKYMKCICVQIVHIVTTNADSTFIVENGFV